MFDWVKTPPATCSCGHPVDDWQSKDLECNLDVVSINDVNNFYSPCGKCHKWHEYVRVSYGDGASEFIPTEGGVTWGKENASKKRTGWRDLATAPNNKRVLVRFGKRRIRSAIRRNGEWYTDSGSACYPTGWAPIPRGLD